MPTIRSQKPQHQEATIITGGGRGIGRAIAVRMAKEGAVFIVGRTEKDLVSTCQTIADSGGSAAYLVGDVTDPTTARATVECVRKKGWVLRHLICNAGIGKSGSTETFDPSLWKQIFYVNVNGSFYFIQSCIPEMLINGRGTVCLMSSIAGLRGYGYNTAYVASKHALVGIASSMAQEYGKRGIVSVAVCPGFVEGEMTDRVIHGVMERHHIDEGAARLRIANSDPQGRILQPEEVAEAVAFICSSHDPSLSGHPFLLSDKK